MAAEVTWDAGIYILFRFVNYFTEFCFNPQFVKNPNIDPSSSMYKQFIHTRFPYSFLYFKNQIVGDYDGFEKAADWLRLSHDPTREEIH